MFDPVRRPIDAVDTHVAIDKRKVVLTPTARDDADRIDSNSGAAGVGGACASHRALPIGARREADMDKRPRRPRLHASRALPGATPPQFANAVAHGISTTTA